MLSNRNCIQDSILIILCTSMVRYYGSDDVAMALPLGKLVHFSLSW